MIGSQVKHRRQLLATEPCQALEQCVGQTVHIQWSELKWATGQWDPRCSRLCDTYYTLSETIVTFFNHFSP